MELYEKAGNAQLAREIDAALPIELSLIHISELVKAKFMKLNSSHIEFVFDCMKENTTKIQIGRAHV